MNDQLTVEQQAMLAVWQQHTYAEFVLKDPEAAIATMTENPYVILVPAGTGGVGREGVREFYATQFIPNIPTDLEVISISQFFGKDRLVEEAVARFTHDLRMDWMIPGVPPTGRKVEFVLISVIGFREGKVAYEHLYWDQAAVLTQLGVLDQPVAAAGVESAAKLLQLAGPNAAG